MKSNENIDWLFYENNAINKGYTAVCGVDEAGRGPLAGPVYAAAVILPEGKIIEGVNDSKKLSEKKREALFDVIKTEALSYSIASASAKEIDELNILNATYLAMKRAVEGLDVAELVVLDVDGADVGHVLHEDPYSVKAPVVVDGAERPVIPAAASLGVRQPGESRKLHAVEIALADALYVDESVLFLPVKVFDLQDFVVVKLPVGGFFPSFVDCTNGFFSGLKIFPAVACAHYLSERHLR